MSLADDTRRAAVDVAAAAIAPILPNLPAKVRERAAEAAVRAAAAFLHGEPLFTVERWKVELPTGPVKGIAEDDARRLARELGGTAWRSTITVYADGREELGTWLRATERAPIEGSTVKIDR